MKLEQTIHATFSARAAHLSGRIALDGADRRLDFAELEERSDRIAGFLQCEGVRRGDRVGMFAQRSPDAVAAMLGILKAGAAYVPFDPAYPAKLLRFMYEDCKPALMLVDASLMKAGAEPFWPGAAHDVQAAAAAAGPIPTTALPETGPDDPAYVMYTSGSTGHPKGVLIPHRGVIRLVVDNPFATLGPDEVHLALAPLAFDASTFEIWGALLNGARLAVLTSPYPSLDEIANAISGFGVTTLWLTAGMFHLMVDHRVTGLAPLRQLIAGGDVLSPSHVARAQAALPGCQLINGYGPTENTTFTCTYRIPRGLPAGPIPIGTPIGGTTVHILDDARRPVPDGQEGELYAGGDGLALGYLNRDELTAERFVANPFETGGSSRLYRTGDRVRRRGDGNIEFLGRLDRQVKINGKRVELDEIEACLRRSPLVEDAAVTSPIDGAAPRKVHAYVKLRAGATGGVAQIRDFLKRETADYMIPATMTVMDSLPLSPVGKVDRSKLPPPRAEGPSDLALQPPSGDATEAQLLDLWRSVLGTATVGLNDNFFDLGGTSLQVIQLHARITEVMHCDITVVDLFQYPRISALAARLRPASRDRTAAGVSADPAHAAGRLTAAERASRQQAALARARTTQRRVRHD
jgi:amino acid adenylation domain-containing protein